MLEGMVWIKCNLDRSERPLFLNISESRSRAYLFNLSLFAITQAGTFITHLLKSISSIDLRGKVLEALCQAS